MSGILKSTLIMAMVAFIASFALSHINNITQPEILKQEKEKQKAALKAVLPGYSIKEIKTAPADDSDFQYWIAEKAEDENIVNGYAFITEKPGYSGTVKTMVGIDNSGRILGISILQQSETPGLGARSVEISSTGTFFGALFGSSDKTERKIKAWFQEQFEGLDSGKPIEILKKGDWNESMKQELTEKNAISAITGATITSRTVKDSIEAGIKKLNKIIQEEKTTAEVPE
ncbi:MAG: RnfABCDGE type electron transport complex subunit G [Spirochaetes bacterium]|nr:RnfABCDGE type electron transport complex subunit G [Spirochaetota bacterium]